MTCLVNVYIYWRVALELSTPETQKKPYKTTSIHGRKGLHSNGDLGRRRERSHLHCKMAMATSKLSKIHTANIATPKSLQKLEV
jgi:hypothetical protein